MKQINFNKIIEEKISVNNIAMSDNFMDTVTVKAILLASILSYEDGMYPYLL